MNGIAQPKNHSASLLHVLLARVDDASAAIDVDEARALLAAIDRVVASMPAEILAYVNAKPRVREWRSAAADDARRRALERAVDDNARTDVERLASSVSALERTRAAARALSARAYDAWRALARAGLDVAADDYAYVAVVINSAADVCDVSQHCAAAVAGAPADRVATWIDMALAENATKLAAAFNRARFIATTTLASASAPARAAAPAPKKRKAAPSRSLDDDYVESSNDDEDEDDNDDDDEDEDEDKDDVVIKYDDEDNDDDDDDDDDDEYDDEYDDEDEDEDDDDDDDDDDDEYDDDDDDDDRGGSTSDDESAQSLSSSMIKTGAKRRKTSVGAGKRSGASSATTTTTTIGERTFVMRRGVSRAHIEAALEMFDRDATKLLSIDDARAAFGDHLGLPAPLGAALTTNIVVSAFDDSVCAKVRNRRYYRLCRRSTADTQSPVPTTVTTAASSTVATGVSAASSEASAPSVAASIPATEILSDKDLSLSSHQERSLTIQPQPIASSQTTASDTA